MAAVDVANPRRIDTRIALHDDEVVSSGQIAGIAPRTGRVADVEAALIGPQDGYRCWRKAELPPAWRYGTHPRVPPILCQADEGVHLTYGAQQTRDDPSSPGAHGYAPERASMRAVFLARGPRVARGVTLTLIDATDVHPFLLTLLGLPPMRGDGDPTATRAALRH